jgi:hypothetical protein
MAKAFTIDQTFLEKEHEVIRTHSENAQRPTPNAQRPTLNEKSR